MKLRITRLLLVVSTLGSALALVGASGCNLILGLNDFKNECEQVTEGKPCPDAGLCMPGDIADCYTGPDDTEGKGICKGGKKTCGRNGLFGACEGEVTPKPKEICGNGADDDCNGKVDDGCPCTPGSKMSCYDAPKKTENVGECRGGMAVCNAAGDGYGACEGEVTPKAEDYDKKGDENCDGIPSADTQWVSTFGDMNGLPAYIRARAIAADKQGNLFIGGDFSGTATLGSLTITSPPDMGDFSFMAKLDPTGTPTWAHYLSGIGVVQAIAVDASGHLLVATTTEGTGTLVNAFDESGTSVWSSMCTGTGDDLLPTSITVDAQGSIYVAGIATGPFSCGSKAVGSANDSVSSTFILKLDSTGVAQWGTALATTTAASAAVASAPDGSVWVTGQFTGTSQFGTFLDHTDHGGGDVFLVQLDGSTGATMLADTWGNAAAQAATAIAIHPLSASDYRVAITGANQGSIDFGGGALTTAGTSDGFVAVFDPQLILTWSQGFGGSMGLDFGAAIGIEPSGDVMVAGSVKGGLGFGANEMTANFSSEQATYGLLARFSPDGTFVWVKEYGGDKTNTQDRVNVTSMALEPLHGYAVVAGSYDNAADFGTGAKPDASESGSTFVVQVATP